MRRENRWLIKDSQLLYRVCKFAESLPKAPIQHPLEKSVLTEIKGLAGKIEQGDDYKIYESMGDKVSMENFTREINYLFKIL